MTAARFLSPPSGATVRGSIEVFAWTYNDLPIDSATLELGLRRDQSNPAVREVTSVETISVGDLPVDGSDIHVRLRYTTGGRELTNDVRLVASTDPDDPAIVNPPEGSRLAGATQVFSWVDAELPVDDGWLYLGSLVGGSNYAAVRLDQVIEAKTVEVADLPTDDELGPDDIIHARLYLQVAGAWHHVDHRYQPGPAAAPTKDELTRELQALVGATPDGIVGPLTRAALNQNWLGRPERFDRSFAERFINDQAVVRWVQRRLNTRAGFGLSLDGVFGSATDDAVTRHLGAGGVVAAESFIELLDPA